MRCMVLRLCRWSIWAREYHLYDDDLLSGEREHQASIIDYCNNGSQLSVPRMQFRDSNSYGFDHDIDEIVDEVFMPQKMVMLFIGTS